MVGFYERITTWRKRRRNELARLRMEKARAKLRDAAKRGNKKAKVKLRSIKKADAAKSSKYRKLKKERQEMKKNDVAGKLGEV